MSRFNLLIILFLILIEWKRMFLYITFPFKSICHVEYHLLTLTIFDSFLLAFFFHILQWMSLTVIINIFIRICNIFFQKFHSSLFSEPYPILENQVYFTLDSNWNYRIHNHILPYIFSNQYSSSRIWNITFQFIIVQSSVTLRFQ